MQNVMNVSYDTKIPNNVNLSSDRRVLKALEKWHPGYIDWWTRLIPEQFQNANVYLRTAIGVETGGWAKFDYVKMPEYRWGILLAPQVEDRKIAFGEHSGEKAWQEVPGEYRAMLRRLIVIQGDTEPGSVEQQRFLGLTAPSLYDMRNLFQVNVEEGRHLWAMVYLLQKYFGKDGREEADDLLRRSSGSEEAPRMLGAFNEETPDWLSFFMFTYFTDRDGKFQLKSLAESAFDPLARTCQFMLTEEAHHMFVGETGIGRIVKRTLDLMKQTGTDDPETIRAVLDEAGLDGRHMAERIQDPAVKAKLVANTEDSVARGAFGIPTFFVDGEIYFGKDSLRDVEDAIASVEGVDMVLIGPSDLTAEMGIHGQYENERFRDAVDSVAAACRTHGVALGMAGIKSLDLLKRFVGLGLRFISAGTDVGMMTEAATARAQALRGLDGTATM